MKKTIATLTLVTTLAAIAAPPWLVDTTTPHVVGGVTHYGDIFPVPWDKMNSNTLWFSNELAVAKANLNTQSNNLVTVSNTVATTVSSNQWLSLRTDTNTADISALRVVVGGLTNTGFILIPSNTWNLASITTSIPNKAFWMVNSNGADLVTVWRSNTSGYYVTWSNGIPVRTPAW